MTCTTLGPTLEATLATGSSAGIGEEGSEEACGEALTLPGMIVAMEEL